MGERGSCVVYGNCQAGVLRHILGLSPAFAARYVAAAIPDVHTITGAALPEVQQAMSDAALVVTQPVGDGYHGLPLGSREMTARVPSGCRVVTIPALHYDGLFPYQVYVRDPDDARPLNAPLTVYHDVRFLYCAAQGWDVARSQDWLAQYAAPADVLRGHADYALNGVRSREEQLDVRIADVIGAPDMRPDSFFTVNHPTLAVFDALAARIHAVLGLPYVNDPSLGEPLGDLRAPLEGHVLAAVGVGVEPRPDWLIRGERHTLAQLLELHLRWYGEHPQAIGSGLSDHDLRMRGLGLGL